MQAADASAETLLLERHEGVALLRLNIPHRLNPLALPLQQRLRQELATLAGDREVRALVITGAGKAFCVGADLASMQPQPDTSLGEQTAGFMASVSNRLIQDLRELPFPVVAAVNGPCAGAGVGLALAADIVVAAKSAYFYLPFIPRLGIVPDLGTTWFFERFVGRARATALTLLGERLPAQQAVDWGLIWSCVDDAALLPAALEIAGRLARGPAHAALEVRRVYERAGSSSLAEQMQHEADRQRELIDRPEFAEGVRAFLEKREPRFPGR